MSSTYSVSTLRFVLKTPIPFPGLFNCVEEVAATTHSTDPAQICFQCVDIWVKLWAAIANFYFSEDVERIITEGDFDVIIAEDLTMKAVAMVTNKMKIPIASFSPVPTYDFARLQQNLPMMLNSENSGMTFHISSIAAPPTFLQRAHVVFSLVRLIKWVSSIEKVLVDNYGKYGITSNQDILDRISLFLVNAHPAYSLPHLAPANLIEIGAFHLQPSKPLRTGPLSDFIESSTKDIIYLSIGSYGDPFYFFSLNKDLPNFSEIIQTISQLNYRVILKVRDMSKVALPDFSEDWYVTEWVPQKDLLGSGNVKLFISHCGNNGRIESVYYNVPLLCIPLWGDNMMNAMDIQAKKFGKTLLKEDLKDTALVHDVINSMVSNFEMYRDNMRAATEILLSEPAKGKDKIRFYLEMLIKHGHLHFLQNQVLKKQTFVEVSNLDVVLCIVGVLVVMLALALLAVRRIIGFVIKLVRNKKDKSD